MKTYICNNELKETLLSVLLKDKPSIFGIQIISPNEFLQDIFKNEELNVYDIYVLIKDLPLGDLKGVIKDPAFLKEALNNRYLLDFYQIDLTSLNLHAEYKTILNSLPHLDIAKFKSELAKNRSDYFIVDGYYPYAINEFVIKPLKAQGAKTFTFEKEADHKDYQIKTQNYRQSIDKIATYIIKNNLDIKDCAVIASADQFDLVQTNFDRYNIPCYTNRPTLTINNAQVFVAFMDFYLNQDRVHFMKLVSLNALKLKNNNSIDVRDFLADHLKEFKLELSHEYDDSLLNPNDDHYYFDLQNNYNQIMGAYLPFLTDLCASETFDEAITKTFDQIKDTSKGTAKIKRIIEKYRDNLKQAYPFFRQELLDAKVSADKQGLSLVSFNEEIYLKKYLFVLNPEIKSYPGFKARDGFLNEHVLEGTNYPSIEARYQHHLTMHDYLKTSISTFYLMPGSSIDGKPNEFDDRLKDLSSYENQDIITNENPAMKTPNHQLGEKATRAAFFKDNQLIGSISSFEKYFGCPYAYFLNYGLGLYTPRTSEHDPAAAGTIVHKIFEELGKEYGKNYANATEADVDKYLKPYIDKYALLYPIYPELNTSMFNRIKALVLLELIFLKSMEDANAYRPIAFEYPFTKQPIASDGIDTVMLKGVIDRVDETANFFRIIDYKTSNHELSEKDVKQGLQLQLLTYALVYQNITGKKPIGQFYLNVVNAKKTIEPYGYKKTDGGLYENLPIDNEIEDAFIKAHKLSGLVYNDDPNLDDGDYSHMQTGRSKGSMKSRTIDLDNTRALIQGIYEYLLTSIKNGEISLRPVETACTYCDYHQICHFKGLKLSELEPVVEGSLKKKDKEDK